MKGWLALGVLAGATLAWAQPPIQADAAVPALDPQRQADHAWLQAQQAIGRQDWARAELWLERVLMLAPQRADAMLELARVLQAQGRREAARALLQALAADARTPTLQRRQLRQWLAELEGDAGSGSDQAPPRPTHWAWQAGLALGRHTNPLALTSATEVTLTLPGGPLRLPLASRPQPGGLAVADLTALGPGGARGHVQWARTDVAGSQPAWRLSAHWPLPWTPAGGWLQIADQRALDGGRRSTALAGLALGDDAVAADQRPAVAVGLYREAARRGALLRGQLPRVAGGAGRAWAADAWAELELAARPQPDVLRAGVGLQWRPQPWLALAAGLQGHLDLQGYSPWLADGAPRRLLTAEVHAAWTLWSAPGGAAALMLSAGATRRTANLEPWSSRGAYVQLHWRQAWR